MGKDQTPIIIDIRNNYIEDISKLVAELYEDVTLTKNPMFKWIQIINNVTILGEEVRRRRYPEALEYAGRVFMRLLEFIGHYMYIHENKNTNQSSDLVAGAFQNKSYGDRFAKNTLDEGPT